MDISALVNHDGDAAVLPRRSLSNSHSVSVPSPVSVAAKLPSTPNTTRRQMPLKRKRYDPKPVWAYRENESLPPELQRLLDETHSQRAPPPAVQQHTPQPQAQPGSHPQGNGPASNGHGAPPQRVANGLVGYERPISDTAHVYDEVSRTACDFIFNNAVNNEMLRNAIAESEHTQLEIEARWGHIIDKGIGQRLRGYHDSETIIKSQQIDTKFESTMTEVQHKRMNEYLNGEVEKSRKPGASRDAISYKHTYEVDMFYDLGQDQFKILPPAVQGILQMAGQRQRIRVTRDRKTNQVLRSMIKHRIANLDISSPRTEWDYRIGINLEINYPGPVEELKPVVEAGKTPESMKRQKDRMSYSYLGAFQIDLTQVVSGTSKNHELELELNSDVLLENADKMNKDMPNDFEHLINGMMNNLRIMSRQIT